MNNFEIFNSLFPRQREATKLILNTLLDHNTPTFAHIGVAGGKTRVACAMAAILSKSCKTILVTSKKSLVEDITTVLEYFGAKVSSYIEDMSDKSVSVVTYQQLSVFLSQLKNSCKDSKPVFPYTVIFDDLSDLPAILSRGLIYQTLSLTKKVVVLTGVAPTITERTYMKYSASSFDWNPTIPKEKYDIAYATDPEKAKRDFNMRDDDD